MSKFQCQIVDTGAPTTLQGSQLDYLLVSNVLVSSIQLQPEWEAPWKPHCGLAVTLSCDTPDVEVQQLQRFPPIGKVHTLPQCWSTFHEADGPFSIAGIQITGLGSDLARWASQTEQYLTQQLHKPTTGRGHHIQLRKAPLVDQIRQQVWKKGQLAYWERMAVRVNIPHLARQCH